MIVQTGRNGIIFFSTSGEVNLADGGWRLEVAKESGWVQVVGGFTMVLVLRRS